MLITRTSPLTGKTNTLDLPITRGQLATFNMPKGQRPAIQDIFPNLSPAQREFLLTGYTEEDWATIFPPEEEEVDA